MEQLEIGELIDKARAGHVRLSGAQGGWPRHRGRGGSKTVKHFRICKCATLLNSSIVKRFTGALSMISLGFFKVKRFTVLERGHRVARVGRGVQFTA